MSLVTSAHERILGEKFDLFCSYVNPQTWLRRVSNLASELRGNPLLHELLLAENKIPIALARATDVRNHGSLFPFEINTDAGYAAATFVAQVAQLSGALSEADFKRLCRRIEGAIARNSEDLQAIRHELSIGVHFSLREWTVSLPEYSGESVAGDLLLRSRSGDCVTVECKYITNDKGRKIPRRLAVTLCHLVVKTTKDVIEKAQLGFLVQIRPRNRLPNDLKKLTRLASIVPEALISHYVKYDEDVEIFVRTFDLCDSPFADGSPTEQEIDRFVFSETGLMNTQAMVYGFSAGGSLVLQLASFEKDSLEDALSDTLFDAATRQLKGVNNSLLCVKLGGLTAQQLNNIGKDFDSSSARSANMLQRVATAFFESSTTSHIAGVTFMADDLPRSVHGTTSETGCAYSFWRQDGDAIPKELRACFT